jgi:hypothetical protein
MTTQLPIINHGGTRWFRDDRLREFRAVDNPHRRLPFDNAPEAMLLILDPLPKAWKWGDDISLESREAPEASIAGFCVEHLGDIDCHKVIAPNGDVYNIQITATLVRPGTTAQVTILRPEDQ